MAGNPAEPGYGLFKVLQDISDLQAAVKRLEQAAVLYAEEATVTAYTGGTTCTVHYDTGTTRTVAYATTYTPTVGHRVLILNYRWGPVKGVALSRISA